MNNNTNEIKTFRAKTLPQALQLVRQELGPEASVLHTREVRQGLLGKLFGAGTFEISASRFVEQPYPQPAVFEPENSREPQAENLSYEEYHPYEQQPTEAVYEPPFQSTKYQPPVQQNPTPFDPSFAPLPLTPSPAAAPEAALQNYSADYRLETSERTIHANVEVIHQPSENPFAPFKPAQEATGMLAASSVGTAGDSLKSAPVALNDFSSLPEMRDERISEASRILKVEPTEGIEKKENGTPANLENVATQISYLQQLIADLTQQAEEAAAVEAEKRLPESLFQAYADLIEENIPEEIAHDILERIQVTSHEKQIATDGYVESQIEEQISQSLKVSGPIQLSPTKSRLVALVGPTGVGKTTTIAKLAANFHLNDKKKVGLITVDTYRVAAVEQLRTYADIIDLPMEVVSTPEEMQAAVERMAHLDLVLMDTAGRSPRDEVRIQELKEILDYANPDEVHLVLSCTSSAKNLAATAERFSSVGISSLLLTKLDEAIGLGHLLPLAYETELPFSYLTDGQNVPDDIQIAEKQRWARLIMGREEIKSV